MVVALSLALTMAGTLAALFPGPLPQDWETLLLWHGDGGFTDRLDESFPENGLARAALLVAMVGIVSYVFAVFVGLFLFRRYARFGFACICALQAATVAFEGLVVMTPLEAAALQLALMLDGAIVAMSYLPPIAREFEPRNPSSATWAT